MRRSGGRTAVEQGGVRAQELARVFAASTEAVELARRSMLTARRRRSETVRAMLELGLSVREVAAMCGTSHQTIHRLATIDG